MLFVAVHAAIAVTFVIELLLAHPFLPQRFPALPNPRFLVAICAPFIFVLVLSALQASVLVALPPLFAYAFGFAACARRVHAAVPLLVASLLSSLGLFSDGTSLPVPLVMFVISVDAVCVFTCTRNMVRDALVARRCGYVVREEAEELSATLLASNDTIAYGAIDPKAALRASASESGSFASAVFHSRERRPLNVNSFPEKCVLFLRHVSSWLPIPLRAAASATVDLWGSGADDITECVDNTRRTVPPNVRTASLLGILAFQWMNPLIVRGRAHNLEVEDMPMLAPHLRCLATGPQKFDRIWRDEVRCGGNHRLWRALARAFGPKLLVGGGLRFLNDIFMLLSPLILRRIILHLQYASTHPNDPNIVKKGILLSVLLMVDIMCTSLCFHHYGGNAVAVQAQVQGCLVTTVYAKSVKISAEARSHFTSGFVHNLMATDSRTIADLSLYIHAIWGSASQLVFSLALLVGLLGIFPTLAGIALIIVTVPVQKFLVDVTHNLRVRASGWTDERVKIVSEAISDMQIVKLMAWETSFMKRITDARIGELKLVRFALNVKAATYGIVLAVPVGLALMIFGTFALLGGVLDAAVVFPAIAIFSIIRAPMFILPESMIHMARSAAAVDRIQRFLDANELKSLSDSSEHSIANESFVHSDADIVAIDASFSWDRNLVASLSPTLTKISCVIPRGSLTCIVGPTAAGKSSFLSAIIGEVELIGGRIGVRSGTRSALCSQTPFIRNCTLRDNVLFGLPLNMERYRRTLRVCNLLPDLLTLPAGDLTEIGDRGTNLSGGQKARVSLARAVYSQHEIVLMDAPLAAVDAHVARSIFVNCVVNEMAGRTRLMTTNSLNFASSPDVDYIVVLKDGEMVEFGKCEKLLADSSSYFAKMIASESVDGSEQARSENGAELDVGEDNDGVITARGFVSLLEKKKIAMKNSEFAAAVASHNESGIRSSDEFMVDKEKVEHVTEADRNRRGELFRRETKEVGKVKPRHYREYMNAVGGIKWAGFIVSLALLSQTLSVGVNVWLSFWSERSRVQTAETVISQQTRNLVIYTSLCSGTILVTAAQMFALASASVRASVWLHEKLMVSVFGAPMSFFDTTPKGRVVNRSNASIDRIDNNLIFSIRSVLDYSLMLISTMLLILLTIPSFVFVLIPAAVLFFLIREYFRRTVIDLRRLESVSRSPLYSHFGEMLDGVMTIRAYGAAERMMAENRDLADIYISTNFASHCCNRWLSIRLEFVASLLLFGVSVIAVLCYRTISPELSGLALSYAMQVVTYLAYFVRLLTETESNFSSVEQVSEYTTIPPFLQEEKLCKEPTEQVSKNEVENLNRNQSWGLVSKALVHKILADQNQRQTQRWPRRGHIDFTNVTMRYRPGLKPALSNLSMEIMPGWHLGIVGRTGAGKSSLIGTLFRLQQLEHGRICIDGQDIAALRLRDLRRSLSVIAQDPVLFSGTIRSNLDMTGSYNEEEVQRAFNKCGLKETTSNELTLDTEVSEGGANFSTGQRQLLCLGRALLRDSTVLVLDEATASLDDFTDRKLGETIRREMGHCTIITVAHRLHTVMRSSRVCVLDKGRVLEFDDPRALLERVPKSAFAVMVEETGPKTARYLRSLAYMSRVPSDLYQRSNTTKTNDGEHLRDRALWAFRFLRATVADVESEEWRNELLQNNLTVETWKRSLRDMISALTSIAQDTLIGTSLDNLPIASIRVDPDDELHLNAHDGSPR